jgi:hypothetical protein
MKPTLPLLLSATLLAFAANPPQTFTGVITDTMCGKTHGMMPGQSNDKCIATCVKGSSSQYALYDGHTVLKLSDQKAPARFAAQRVRVSGTLDEKTHTIKVASIEPEGAAK